MGARRITKTEVEKVSVAEVIASLDYLRWDHPIVMKSFNLARQVDTWLHSCYSVEACPHVHLSIAKFGVVIMINDCCVWDSESNDETELTVDFVKGKLKDQALDALTPFE